MYRVIKETKGSEVSYKLQRSFLGIYWKEVPFLFYHDRDKYDAHIARCSIYHPMNDEYHARFLKFVKDYFKKNPQVIKYKEWNIFPAFFDIDTDDIKVKFVYGSKWVTPKDTLYLSNEFNSLEECKKYLKEYYESHLETVETIG